MNDESFPPARKSHLAIASLVLGILSVPPLVALILNYAFGDLGLFVGIIISMAGMPLALIFGIVALNKIRAAGGRITGRGLAISGLFMGGVSFLLLAAMFFPALRSAREKDHRSQCLNNLKQIGVAIGIYAKEHDGNIPRTFDDLRPYATNLGKLLICPSARERSHPSYQIVLEGKKWNSDETMDAIVVTEPFSNHRTGRMVLYGDGHVSYNFDSAKSD